MEKKNSLVKFYHIKDEIIAVGVLMAFAFFMNRGINIKGLWGEDLSLWASYCELPFWKFVFPVGSPHFRFLYNLLAYIQLAVVGSHMTWFVPCNIMINGLIAYTVFRLGRWASKNSVLGFLCGFLYLLSEKACYQISQAGGFMESVALWMAIGILYCLFQYINQTEKEQFYFIAANVLYFGICFVHERYVSMILVLVMAYLVKVKKKPWIGICSVAVFALVQIIWGLATGSIMTYPIRWDIGVKVFWSGLDWVSAPRWIKALIIVSGIIVTEVILIFLVKTIKDKAQRKHILCNVLLFGVFLAVSMTGSEFFEETQNFWLYTSETAAGVFLVYMCGVIGRPRENALPNYPSMLAGILTMLVFTLILCPMNSYYRKNYFQRPIWHGQQQANSLAQQTYEKYGEAFFGKRLYILNGSYKIKESDIKTFARAIGGKKRTEGILVFFVDSIRDFGQVTDNMLILREEPEFHGYQDITEFVRQLKCEAVYGYYEDTWMEEKAKLRVMAGETGRVRLQLLYPGAMTGEEVSSIYLNGVLAQEVRIENNITYVDLQAEPYDTVELDFENNFYFRGNHEKRGQGRLAMMVRISTE